MPEVYKIVANLVVTGNADKSIALFTKAVKEASIATESLLRLMSPLNSAMRRLNESILGGENRTKRFTREMLHLNTALSAVAHSGARAGESLASIRGPHRGAGGFSRIERAESSNALGYIASGAVAGGASRELMHLAMSPAGLAAGAAGYLGFKGFEQSSEFQRNVAVLKSQGLSSSNINQAVSMANGSNISGISSTALIQAYVAAHMATQDPNMARAMAIPLAKNEFSSSVLFKNNISKGDLQAMATVGELRGHGDQAAMGAWIENALKMNVLSGNRLSYSSQAQFFRRALNASSNLTPEGYFSLEPVMQAMGASSVGSSYRTLTRSLTGGMGSNVLTKNTIAFWQKMGMWDAHGGGKYGRMKSNMIDMLQNDPVAWVKQFVLPAFAARGITSPKQMSADLNVLPGVSANLISGIITNMPKEERTRAMAQHLLGQDNIYKTALNTPGGQMQRLSGDWENFAKVLGDTVTPIIVPALKALASSLEFLTKHLSSMHPEDNNVRGGNKMFNFLTGMTMPSGGSKGGTVETHISVSGQKLADTLSPYLYKNMNRASAQQSSSTVNWGTQLVPPSVPYSGPLSG